MTTERTVRILLVEDEDNCATALMDVLSRETYFTYDMRRASTFAETKELLAREKFDIVFLDLKLPNGIGVELVCRVRIACMESFLLLWTGLHNDKEEIEVLEAMADEYLVKGSHSPDELRRIVRRWAIRIKARDDRINATGEMKEISKCIRETLRECETDPRKPPYPEDICTKDTQKAGDTVIFPKKIKTEKP